MSCLEPLGWDFDWDEWLTPWRERSFPRGRGLMDEEYDLRRWVEGSIMTKQELEDFGKSLIGLG